jgi:hypothetical protein
MSADYVRGLIAGYERLLLDDDPRVRHVAAAQLEALRPRAPARPAREAPPGVSLLALVEQAVGPLRVRTNGNGEGACPFRCSSSRRCFVVFRDGRGWFCNSCRRGGGAVAFVSMFEGITFAEARRRLGLAPAPLRARVRPPIRREVTW